MSLAVNTGRGRGPLNRNRLAITCGVLALLGGRVCAQTRPDERPTTVSENCTTGGCHSSDIARPNRHGPLEVGSCAACHRLESAERHTFRAPREGNDLCLFCHQLERGSVAHQPMTGGQCVDCHDPHGGSTATFLKTTSTQNLCSRCHETSLHEGGYQHLPVAHGGCSACHAAHYSEQERLLVKEPKVLCLDCHVRLGRQLDRSRLIHAPAAEDCRPCHDPHASDERMLLTMPARELCLFCHEDVRSTVEHATTPHGAVVEGRQCLNCHDPHASNYPRLLRNNPRSLCMECHDREIDTPTGTITDMSAILATGKSLHGPIAKDNCSACHQIHGGNQFRMLIKEYPPEFYAPFAEENYALCFSCHEHRTILEPRTETLTGFRNGDLNLHYLHVNKETKGRTCRACHETHASDRAKHIRESVPFGQWELPVGYTKSGTGGSCAPGCHHEVGYDRVNPVIYERRSDDERATWPIPPGPTSPPTPPNERGNP